MEREPTQRTKPVFAEQGEVLGSRDIFTGQQRANEQIFYMDSFRINVETGQYEPALGEFQHQLGPFPDLACRAFKQGRELIYVSYHSATETKFRFGDKTFHPDRGFLAISYVGPVVKNNSFVERFVVRVDCLTEQQAQAVVYEMRSHEGAQGWYRGNKINSFSKDYDPFGKEAFLAQAIKKVVGEENLNTQQKDLVAAIEDQANARLTTHNAEKNQHEINSVFLRDIGKYAVFDSVLNRYVLWEETTSDVNSLAYIYEAQRLTDVYLKDSNPNKAPLVVNFAVALSARTAGFRKEPSAAASRLEVDKNGVARQITDIKNLADVDPRFLLGPVSNWEPDMPNNSTPVLSILPQSPYPVRPVLLGGSVTGINVDHKNNSTFSADFISTTVDMGGTVLAAAFIAPGIVDSAIFTAPLVSQIVTTSDGVTIIDNKLIQNQDVQTAEFFPQTILSDEMDAPSDLDQVVPSDDIWFDVPDVPIKPLPEPTDGGGLLLPQEIGVTIWDRRMAERYRQAQKPVMVFTDKVLPQAVEQENVVFDASKESQEATFKEYASDLEITENLKIEQVEKIAQVLWERQGNITSLLLANYPDKNTQVEGCDKNLHVHEFVTDNKKRHNNPHDEVVNANHYDTAQYHSEEQVSVVKSPEETLKKEPTIRKNYHKNMQLHNFVTDFSFNNLLLSYLRQRQILSELCKQNISSPDAADNNGKNTTGKAKEQKGLKTESKSFLQKLEQHKTQSKKVKVKIKTNPAFLSLLFLTKIKLLTKVKLLARKDNFAGFKQLFVTDTLLLFLLNPKLFLVNKSTVNESNMTDLPNTTNKNTPVKKNYSVRGKNGRFTKSSQTRPAVPIISDDINIPVNTPVSVTPPNVTATPTSGGVAKEIQPGVEQIYLEEAEKTKELKEELAQLEKEAEVKEIKGEVELPEIVKKEGVEVVGEDTPIPTKTTIVLPLDDTKVYHIVKTFKKLHQNVKDSVTWLAFWCWRQLQLLHIKLKEVHGKITRQTI